MSATLYRKYLTADWLIKKIIEAGGKPDGVSFPEWAWGQKPFDEMSDEEFTYGFMFDVSTSIRYVGPEECEELANKLIESTGCFIHRRQGVIRLYGYSPGFAPNTWHIDVGSGVCERVQVGTKLVEKPDPKAVIPMVTVEEPVYEVRCIDPIAAAMTKEV